MKRLGRLVLSILMSTTMLAYSKEQDKYIVKKDDSVITYIAEKMPEEKKEKQKNSTFNKSDIKDGDKILGLKVKSINISDGFLNDVTFSGKIYLSGFMSIQKKVGMELLI